MQFPGGRLCLQLPGDVFRHYLWRWWWLWCWWWLIVSPLADICAIMLWLGWTHMVFDQEVCIAHLLTMFFKSRTKIEDGPGKRGSQVKELCFRWSDIKCDSECFRWQLIAEEGGGHLCIREATFQCDSLKTKTSLFVSFKHVSQAPVIKVHSHQRDGPQSTLQCKNR